MRIKSMLSVIAIASASALAAGTAAAAEQFTTLEGIPAAAMSAGEMAVVRGSGAHSLHIHAPGILGGAGSPVADVITTHLHNNSFLFNDGLRNATTKSKGVVHNAFHPD